MLSSRTGSAPLSATCQLPRSSVARSSSVTLATARSNAKLGAPLTVARVSEIAFSQRKGRFRKENGDMKVTGNAA